MKIVLLIVGAVLLLMGLLWSLQGVGLVGGSFMTGAMTWTYIGMAHALIGPGVLVHAFRQQ